MKKPLLYPLLILLFITGCSTEPLEKAIAKHQIEEKLENNSFSYFINGHFLGKDVDGFNKLKEKLYSFKQGSILLVKVNQFGHSQLFQENLQKYHKEFRVIVEQKEFIIHTNWGHSGESKREK